MKRHEGGFTLIELVVVITLLAILAVVALPRFFSMMGRAGIAAGEGTIGAVRIGTSLSKANRIVQGLSDT